MLVIWLSALAATLLPGHVVQAAPVSGGDSSRTGLLGSSFGVPGQNYTFDYVVVGGGQAGLAVASRLAEQRSLSVAVIEAGSFYELTNGNLSEIPAFDNWFTGKDVDNWQPGVDWGIVTEPQQALLNARVHYPRGRTLGGCSARNYMTYHLPTRGSCDLMAKKIGSSGYGFDRFFPYFTKSQHFTPPVGGTYDRFANSTPQYDPSRLGRGGPLSVLYPKYAQPFGSWAAKGFEAIGLKEQRGFESGKLSGAYAYPLATIRADENTRESSETAFLRPHLGKRNANLITFVETLQQHGISVLHDSPGVGQNMKDHVLFGTAHRVNVVTGSAFGDPVQRAQFERQYAEGKGPMTNPGIDILGWERLPRNNLSRATISALESTFSSDWPEVEYLPNGGFFGYATNFQINQPTDGFQYASVIAGLVATLSTGNVTIRSSDMADAPIVNPNWLSHPADKEVAIAAFKRTRQVWAAPAMRPVLVGDEYFPGSSVATDDQIWNFIQRSFSTIFHAACTCKMGPDNDPMAVLDANARVRGVSGLRVVDASSLPILPPGHPMSVICTCSRREDRRRYSPRQLTEKAVAGHEGTMNQASPASLPLSLPSLALASLAVWLVVHYTRQYLRLAHIPGPVLAGFSNLPRLWWVYRRDAHHVHIAQHRKYGAAPAGAGAAKPGWAPLVRYGPNAVSVGSAAVIDTIYRIRGDPLLKSDFYSVIPPMRKGTILPTIFATQDEALHRLLKRPIASVYSMSNLVSFEPLVDRTIDVFRKELDSRFVATGEACDFGAWLQYFAFDVVGEITFSKRLGFLEGGCDVEGIMASIWRWFEYVAVVGQMPWLDSLWVKNKLVSRMRPAKWSPMVQFANKREEERRAMSAEDKDKERRGNNRDFLSRFVAAMEKDPSIPALPAWTSSNIIAGSDTTAIYLRTMFHQLLTHPATMARLRAELDEAAAQGRLSASTASWKESIALPYLNACFKEAGRIHPPFGLHLERVVPPGGLDIELVDEGKAWTVQNRWFVPQSGLHVRLRKREARE
ncbi:cytochrome P450 [Achaetomium macrosporum]|uniref:Cytochrome P450 n=1 Tax=Achaetomium macrosporum TaxID=79813 RepID=A0AAN7C5R4_9PEZI|nr:cytochrome P450 [Achaetomium macrosporum]